MEETDQDLKEASGPGNQEHESGLSPQGVDAEVEIHDKIKEDLKMKDDEKMVLPQRILDLRRELSTYVSNIQSEADAKNLLRRKQQEEADRLRKEKLENNIKSCQERFEEITRGWSAADQKMTPWESDEMLKSLKKLYSAVKEDKMRHISQLQQELKAGDEQFVSDLKRNAHVLNLMMEEMEDQTKTLSKTYREELADTELDWLTQRQTEMGQRDKDIQSSTQRLGIEEKFMEVFQQESDVLLRKLKIEREHQLKKLQDKELEWLTQRQKEMWESDKKIQNKVLRTFDQSSTQRLEIQEKFMVFDRECQKLATALHLENLKKDKEALAARDSALEEKESMNRSPHTAKNLKKEPRNLLTQCHSQEKQFTKRSRQLSDQYKRNIWQYNRTQERIQHFAVADKKQYEQMWLMMDEEVKQLVEKVLVLDSQIWRQHLGLAWERPHADVMGQAGPIQTQKQARSPSHQVVSESSLTGQALQSGAMMDASVGPTLETETECEELDVCVETGGDSDNAEEVEMGSLSHVVPVLMSSLEHHVRSRESSVREDLSFQHEAYWKSMGDIISEDREKLWDTAEKKIEEYHERLRENLELIRDTQNLEQENAKLRMLLLQRQGL